MASLGGELKRREMLSGRLADALAWMYLASASLKRFRDDGEDSGDWPFCAWACEHALAEGHARAPDTQDVDLGFDPVVVHRHGAPVVDRDAREQVLAAPGRVVKLALQPLVAALLEVREEDGVVDVAEPVEIAPADLDALSLSRHVLAF